MQVFINLGQNEFMFRDNPVTINELRASNILRDKIEPAQQKKKRGIGYAEGASAAWSMDEHALKSAREAKLTHAVLKLLQFLLSRPLLNSSECADLLAASPLVPSLIALFRNDSLTDMAKSFEVYLAACDVVQILARGAHTRAIAVLVLDELDR
jgi:hypothetical protein